MTHKNIYKVIGVMSGTSLDGIDLVEIEFTFTEGWDFKIGASETVGYPIVWKQKLQAAVSFSEAQLEALNVDYTELLAQIISDFIKRNKLKQLDAVCSHGHTILHQPEKGVTLQMGNLSQISKLIQQTVVCDFRIQDVALGGQGAPLVPVGDQLLFRDYDYCLNLGGFANISFQKNEKRLAYDVCPVNIVLNKYAEKLGSPYDDEGQWAASGTVDALLLATLNALHFYTEKGPKSLGLEWVKQQVFPILEASKISNKDKLRTFTEHIVIQLATTMEHNKSVLITGGGAYNRFLIQRLQALSEIEIILPTSNIIEFKEAIIFGLLGVLKLRNEVNCLASVTGAKMDHSSGNIFLP